MIVEKHKQHRKKCIKRQPIQKQTRAIPLVPKVRADEQFVPED